MRTLMLDPPPPEVRALLERRRQLGLDRKDEVWEGVLHVVPAPDVRHAKLTQQLAVIFDAPARKAGLSAAMAEFNLGESEQDYRVPDGGLLHPKAAGTWVPTAPLVVEILSPGDESWQKLPFYAARNVTEVLILDPQKREVHWLVLTDGRYEPTDQSGLLDLSAASLARRIEWP